MTQVATHARRRPLRGLSRVVFIVLGLAYLSPAVAVREFLQAQGRHFQPDPDPEFHTHARQLRLVAVVRRLPEQPLQLDDRGRRLDAHRADRGGAAAYSLARSGDRGKLYMLALLAARMLPAMVLAVPLFVIASNLGLTDTYAAVIAAHLTFSIPFTVWMMRGFFAGIPAELHEAARLDSCQKHEPSSR